MLRPLALALLAVTVAAPALATENKTLSCKTYLARWAGSSGGPALVANVPRSMTPIDLNAVQFTDKKLGKKMIVEGLFAQRTAMDGLKVMARLVNCSKEPLVVQLRSNFMDANQLPTEAASAWKTVFLSPKATAVYEENSIGRAMVASYLIELRPES
jgi:hypothetical protein